MTTIVENKINTYDETPYHSYPYAQSRPEYLRTLGTLFGMNPPEIETARVLELGCAEGGNIIPHAVKYPKAKFVGIDLSKVQIDAAQIHIQKLGLKNIELKHMSITDIDEKFGEFDYIICHGVISWVPDFVREKIFQVCSKNLSKNGIAYISYNTLPGWNMIRTIRDMMLYHSKDFKDPKEKVAQARLLLNFVSETLEGADSPYAQILKQESGLLSKQNDHYLRHDHLEEDNKQFYFNEFMQQAGQNGLQYLSDATLSTMYLGNMPKDVAEKLKDLNDIVRTEQYMDFITNRRFRSTLLCRSDVKLNRSLTVEDGQKFAMTLNVQPERVFTEAEVEGTELLKFSFEGNNDNNISTTSPELKAVLYTFAENVNNPLKFDEIVKKAIAKLKGNRIDKVKQELLNNGMLLTIKGYIQISLENGNRDKVNLDKPKMFELAAHQAVNTPNTWVTSLLHSAVGITVFDKFAAKYMDGKHSKDQIVEKLVEEVKKGNLSIKKDEQQVSDEQEIKQNIASFLDNTIARFSSQAVLV